MKQGAVIACLCTALAAPTLAADRKIDAQACLNDAARIETITDAMASGGWRVADLDALDDRTIDHIAWIRMRLYVGADTGGQSVDDLLDLQRKTARGMHRKLDLETSKTRVMTRQAGEAQDTALISWLQPQPGVRAVTCLFAQIIEDGSDMGDKQAIHLPPQTLHEDGATLSVAVTRYNTELLPTDVSAIIVTRREVR